MRRGSGRTYKLPKICYSMRHTTYDVKRFHRTTATVNDSFFILRVIDSFYTNFTYIVAVARFLRSVCVVCTTSPPVVRSFSTHQIAMCKRMVNAHRRWRTLKNPAQATMFLNDSIYSLILFVEVKRMTDTTEREITYVHVWLLLLSEQCNCTNGI